MPLEVSDALNTAVARRSVPVDMLVQRSAECDVHDLQAATNTEDRDAAFARRVSQRDLESISRRIGSIDGFVTAAAVARRIDVEAAAKHDTVKASHVFI
jgi:hypothetical protein